jgi:PAS domain S-box-containing protein
MFIQGPSGYLPCVEQTQAERARAEASLRASEAKYRTLFESMGQGYAEIEAIRDHRGRAADFRLVELNPAWERLTGLPAADARGRTVREVVPDIEEWWIEMYARVAREGQPERIEYELAPLGRWYEAHVHPHGSERLAVFYEDITERKLAEQALRAGEERHAFLLKLSDALRPLADPVSVQDTACRTLGQQLASTGFSTARSIWLAERSSTPATSFGAIYPATSASTTSPSTPTMRRPGSPGARLRSAT